MSKMKGKKILSLVLCVTLVCSAVFLGTNVGVKAESPALENPIVDDSGLSIWDEIYFGNYYQSNADEMEPIKWRVLSVDGDNVFLMSDMVLDCLPYNDVQGETSWPECSLRSWLNDEFYNTAFNEDEREKILTSTVDNKANYLSGGEDDPISYDKIYCLSMTEAEDLAYGFTQMVQAPNSARSAYATNYAISKGVSVVADNSAYGGNTFYWLRSPGPGNKILGSIIAPNGGYSADVVSNKMYGVRPVLHLDISTEQDGSESSKSPAWKYAGKKDSNGTETPWEEPAIEGIEINGYEVNNTADGMRTIYTVTDTIDGKEVVERGLVYGVGGYAQEDEVFVDSPSQYVASYAANEYGPAPFNYSEELTSGTSYRMTLKFVGPTMDECTASWYVRAYAKLSDDSYAYSPVETYTIYNIADYLYQGKLMNNQKGHDYLYEKILSKVDPAYQQVDYDE